MADENRLLRSSEIGPPISGIDLPAADEPPLLPLRHKHSGDGAAALPVGWVNLFDVPDFGLAVVVKLGAAEPDLPDRANVEVFLAEVDGDL